MTDRRTVQMDKSDKVKQTTERWADENNRQDTRKRVADAGRQTQVGPTL